MTHNTIPYTAYKGLSYNKDEFAFKVNRIIVDNITFIVCLIEINELFELFRKISFQLLSHRFYDAQETVSILYDLNIPTY